MVIFHSYMLNSQRVAMENHMFQRFRRKSPYQLGSCSRYDRWSGLGPPPLAVRVELSHWTQEFDRTCASHWDLTVNLTEQSHPFLEDLTMDVPSPIMCGPSILNANWEFAWPVKTPVSPGKIGLTQSATVWVCPKSHWFLTILPSKRQPNLKNPIFKAVGPFVLPVSGPLARGLASSWWVLQCGEGPRAAPFEGFAACQGETWPNGQLLVGGLEHFLFSHILGIIFPTD